MSTPSTAWKEVVTPDEDARFLKHAEYLRELQRSKGQKGDRGLHAKGNLGLKAELEIESGLPEHARVGLGAQPGRYRAYVRLSNGMGQRQADQKGDLRGFAVKVVGVKGKKLIPGMESAVTQDFLCINHPATSVRDADEFIAVIRAVQNPLLLLPRLIGGVGLSRALTIAARAPKDLGVKVTPVATTAYYSAAPLSWGRYAVKVAFEPKAAADPDAKRGSGPNYLADELAARLKSGPVQYDFKVQFFTDDQATPIEDHSVEWKSQWLKVGTLTVLPQDVGSSDGQALAERVEKMSFDPWHALVEHRPVGNVMRARNHAYRLSTQERGAAAEPDGSEPF